MLSSRGQDIQRASGQAVSLWRDFAEGDRFLLCGNVGEKRNPNLERNRCFPQEAPGGSSNETDRKGGHQGYFHSLASEELDKAR